MQKVVLPYVARRPVGRPCKIKSTDIKAGLLDAAVTLFAEYGVLGTSVKDIAKKVGVSAAMVYYYFETKEELVSAVVREKIVSNMEDVWKFRPDERGNAVKMIEGMLGRLMDKAISLPWLMPLWSREFVNEGGTLRRMAVSHVPKKSVSVLMEAVKKAQNDGFINRDIVPEILFMSIFGSVMLPFLTVELMKIVHEREIGPERLLSHVKSLFVNGVLARG